MSGVGRKVYLTPVVPAQQDELLVAAREEGTIAEHWCSKPPRRFMFITMSTHEEAKRLVARLDNTTSSFGSLHAEISRDKPDSDFSNERSKIDSRPRHLPAAPREGGPSDQPGRYGDRRGGPGGPPPPPPRGYNDRPPYPPPHHHHGDRGMPPYGGRDRDRDYGGRPPYPPHHPRDPRYDPYDRYPPPYDRRDDRSHPYPPYDRHHPYPPYDRRDDRYPPYDRRDDDRYPPYDRRDDDRCDHRDGPPPAQDQPRQIHLKSRGGVDNNKDDNGENTNDTNTDDKSNDTNTSPHAPASREYRQQGKGARENPDDLCYNCNRPGHTSHSCPLPPTGPGQCYYCRVVGHQWRDCPSKNTAIPLETLPGFDPRRAPAAAVHSGGYRDDYRERERYNNNYPPPRGADYSRDYDRDHRDSRDPRDNRDPRDTRGAYVPRGGRGGRYQHDNRPGRDNDNADNTNNNNNNNNDHNTDTANHDDGDKAPSEQNDNNNNNNNNKQESSNPSDDHAAANTDGYDYDYDNYQDGQ